MNLIGIAGVVAIVIIFFGAIAFGILPPPGSEVLIRISKGRIGDVRGTLAPHVYEGVLEIVQQADLARGFIAISRDQRVHFSRDIPKAIHQRLRNVLLN